MSFQVKTCAIFWNIIDDCPYIDVIVDVEILSELIIVKAVEQGDCDLEARLLSEDVFRVEMILQIGGRELCACKVVQHQQILRTKNQCQKGDKNTDAAA